jgi:hypothetical protein
MIQRYLAGETVDTVAAQVLGQRTVPIKIHKICGLSTFPIM